MTFLVKCDVPGCGKVVKEWVQIAFVHSAGKQKNFSVCVPCSNPLIAKFSSFGEEVEEEPEEVQEEKQEIEEEKPKKQGRPPLRGALRRKIMEKREEKKKEEDEGGIPEW